MRIERWIIAAAFLPCSHSRRSPARKTRRKKGKAELPKAVKKALKAKYPGAKIRGISKEKNEEGETIYEVELTVKTQR